jgi:hypothetical protein
MEVRLDNKNEDKKKRMKTKKKNEDKKKEKKKNEDTPNVKCKKMGTQNLAGNETQLKNRVNPFSESTF